MEQLKTSLEELKSTVTQQADQIMIQTTSSNTLLPPNFNNSTTTTPYFGASSSSNLMVPYDPHHAPKNMNNMNYDASTPSAVSTMPWICSLPAPMTPSSANHHVYVQQ